MVENVIGVLLGVGTIMAGFGMLLVGAAHFYDAVKSWESDEDGGDDL